MSETDEVTAHGRYAVVFAVVTTGRVCIRRRAGGGGAGLRGERTERTVVVNTVAGVHVGVAPEAYRPNGAGGDP